jgi:predicted dehydrogenase
MKTTLNVGLIGYQFMGRMHTNAWMRAPLFFNTNIQPVRKLICGIPEKPLQEFAEQWGWEEYTTDWHELVERPDIDIVDISAPTFLHHDMAVAVAKAGKHIFCEKPLALNAAQAREMYETAKCSGVVHYVNHNYRRNPAVMLAKRLIDEGKIGKIFHWRSAYLQSWIIDPNFPLTWHLKKEMAGMGPQIDLNSHSVDLARFLVGDIAEVTAMTKQFISERPLPNEGAATFKGGTVDGQKGKVTVEDAAFMLVKFENGAMGSIETSRFATGRKNYNYFEIYGERGSILFDQERMNELQFYSVDDANHAQGFRTILVTEPEHAYVDHWWPPGHIIGYEHAFVHAVVDFLKAIETGGSIEPNFYDGVKVMEVLEAGITSAETGSHVSLSRIKT